MLSISRSRHRFLAQFMFIATNAVGVLLATVYNSSTPDLYPNNAHHKLGWVLTWIVVAHVLLGMLSTYVDRKHDGDVEERTSFIPISQAAMREHQRVNSLRFQDAHRFSYDSGHGTEPNTESLRSHSISSAGSEHVPLADVRDAIPDEDEHEKVQMLRGSKLDRFLSAKLSGTISSKLLRTIELLYDITDRYILLLAWSGYLTGWVTFGGFFVSFSLPPMS